MFLKASGVDILAARLAHLHDMKAGQVSTDITNLVICLLADVADVHLLRY
jgi:hypothetical protein